MKTMYIRGFIYVSMQHFFLIIILLEMAIYDRLLTYGSYKMALAWKIALGITQF